MEHIEATEPSRPNRWATLLTAVVLFASGVGIGWLVTDPEVPEEAVEAAEPLETSFTTEAPETATTMTVPETVNTDPLLAEGVGDPIADVVEAALPSVVQIEVFEGGIARGVGTGVIFDESGLILTAQHVVRGLAEVQVRLSDGNGFVGTVLGEDEPNDIAVIRIDAEGLVAAPLALGDKPRPGATAIALGSPWGLDSTVTSGIVSAVDRTLPSSDGLTVSAMLQTDASINPGNSGGPLFDAEGRVIGINVSIFSSSGANDGVGFAVPIDRAYRVARALIEGREFVPGFLGVRLTAPTDLSAGAFVGEVTEGTAAARAGIAEGDRVLAVNDVPIATGQDLAAQIRSFEPGDRVEITLSRDGDVSTINVVLGARSGGETDG